MSDRTIYYLALDTDVAYGGIRVLYRHVDILNDAGIRAAILHGQPGFRCTWFENTTPVFYLSHATFEMDDVIVVPEVVEPDIVQLAPRRKKVVFNQSGSLTFAKYPVDASIDSAPYLHPDFKATMVVSKHVQDYVKFAFPKMSTVVAPPSVDVRLFAPVHNKRRQICFMPRRGTADAQQVFNLLKFRGDLRNFKIVPIDNLSHEEVARVMQESALFFSFGAAEGFGLPPAEAMSAGCIVVGYHGWGGADFFLPTHSFPVEPGDILGFAEQAARALELARTGKEKATRMGKAASSFIAARYSPENEARAVLEAWRGPLSSAALR